MHQDKAPVIIEELETDLYYKYINANKDKQQLFVELMINQTIIF